MTILPTKKTQEGKNGDAEFEDGRTNRGTRVRGSRDRTRAAPSSDVNANSDCSTATSINSPNSRFEYTSEVEKRENPDCGSIPYKRTRHRSAPSAKLSLSGMDCRGTMTRRHSNEDDTEEGYNSSDEHGPYEADPDIAKVRGPCFTTQLAREAIFYMQKATVCVNFSIRESKILASRAIAAVSVLANLKFVIFKSRKRSMRQLRYKLRGHRFRHKQIRVTMVPARGKSSGGGVGESWLPQMVAFPLANNCVKKRA